MRSALLVVLVLAVATSARAQEVSPSTPPSSPADDEAAREHFESGRAYYQRAQYEDAAREFGEAYRLSHRPALLLNASRALEGAGRFQDAADDVQHFLDTAAADDPDRAGTDERLVRLRASAERMRQTRAHATSSDTHAPPPRPPPPPPRGLTDLQIGGIVTGAAGVLVAVAGLVVGLVADGVYQNLAMTCPHSLCPPSRQGDIDTGSAEAMASSMLFAAAIVAVATGAVLLAFGGYHAPAPVTPTTPAHHSGVSVRWLGSGLALEWGL